MEFKLPTKDGLATLTREIDFPDRGPKLVPLVVMVPGTGLFDRNVLFGRSNTDRDFVFKELSIALNAVGIATLRFDYRGVYCNSRTIPARTNCVDSNIRKTVTAESIQADILQLYDYGAHLQGIDSSKIGVLAHSEGTIHTSRLIGAKLINPKSVTFMGMVAESPKGILHYQIVGRSVDYVFKADANHDGILTNEEITVACDQAGGTQDYCDKLKSPSGAWTRESFAASAEVDYQKIAQDALMTPEDQPYPHPSKPGDRIQASYRWWKMWFTDDRMDVDDLLEYRGQLFVHNGDIDSQTPGIREFEIIRSRKSSFRSFPILTLHSGKGHGLGSDPLYGPMEPEIQTSIVNEMFSAMK